MSSKKSSTSAKGTAEVPSATAPVANNTAAVKAKTLHAFFVRNNPSPAPSADPSTIEIHTPSPVGLTVTTEISPSHIASTSTPVDLVTPCNKGDQIDTKNEEEQPDVADASSSALVSDANPNTPVVESKASESVPSSQNAPSSSSTSNSNPKAPLFALFQKKKAAPSGSAVPTSTKETETEEISPPQPTEEVAESKASSEKAEEIIDDNEEAETENVNKEDEAIESSAFPRKRNRELDRLAKKCRGEEDAINVFDSTVEQNGIRRSTRVRQPPTKFTEEEEGEDEEAMYVKVDSGTKKARKSVDKGTTSADAVAVDDDEDDEVKVVGEGSTPTTSATKPKKASKSSEGKGGVHFFATPEEKARLKALEKEEQARKKFEEEQARKRQQALDTELRLQEEILKEKIENDRFLASSTTNRTNSSASIFNRLYHKPSKSAMSSSNTVVLVDVNDHQYESADTETLPLITNIATPSAELQHSFDRLSSLPDDSIRIVHDRQIVPTSNPASTQPVEIHEVVDISEDDLSTSLTESIVEEIHPETTLHMRSLWTDYIASSGHANNVEFSKLDRNSTACGRDYSTAKATMLAWLKEWINRRNASHGHVDRKNGEGEDELINSDEDFDDESNASNRENFADQLDNIFFAVGPLASGKTNLVWECARQLKINIIEINASQARSSKDVKSIVSEASQSRKLQRSTSDAIDLANDEEVGVADFSLILFDEVDLVLDESEGSFHNALRSLAGKTKCPIVLTAERIPLALQDLRFVFTYLPRPSLDVVSKRLQSYGLPASEAFALTAFTGNDIRASMQTLDLISSRTDCELVMETSSAGKRRKKKVKGDLSKTVGEWMLRQQADFALFDHSIESMATNFCASNHDAKQLEVSLCSQIFVPVILKVKPNLIRVNNTEPLTIEGKNFLQRKYPGANQLANVHLYIDSEQCDVEIVSDTKLTFVLPKTITAGIKVLKVTLSFTSAADKHQPIVLSSSCTGVGGSWLIVTEAESTHLEVKKYLSHKYCRSYDYTRSVHASLMRASSAESAGPPSSSIAVNTEESCEKTKSNGKSKRLVRPQRVVRYVSSESQLSKEQSEEAVAEDEFDPIESFSEDEHNPAEKDDANITANEPSSNSGSRQKRHRFDSDEEEEGGAAKEGTSSTSISEKDAPEDEAAKRQRTQESPEDVTTPLHATHEEEKIEEVAASTTSDTMMTTSEQLDDSTTEVTNSCAIIPKLSEEDLLNDLQVLEEKRRSLKLDDCFRLPPGFEYVEDESLPFARNLPSRSQATSAVQEYESLLACSDRIDYLSDIEMVHSFAERSELEGNCFHNVHLVQHSSLVYHSLAKSFERRFVARPSVLDLTVDNSSPSIVPNNPVVISLMEDAPTIDPTITSRDERKDEQALLTSHTQSAYLGFWYERYISRSTLSFFIQMNIKDNIIAPSLLKSCALMTETIPFLSILARFGLLAENRQYENSLRDYNALSDRSKSKRQVPQRPERFKYLKNAIPSTNDREIEDVVAITKRLVRFTHPAHVQLPDF